ncbi:hypothetical protein V5799_010085 [Amblyomma americanum]|uniref:Uncharacterized protein n=1 Tax=Amblyomma americanum TaxID=6943 RepID=A0AAQ4F8M1_AMBAM
MEKVLVRVVPYEPYTRTPPKPREEDEMRFSGLRRDQIPSRSFQVLQKMTGADDQPYQQQQQYYYPPQQQEPPPDIREYCNHPEELDDTTINPRYRGGNIPSRSFKMLQEMTGDDGSVAPSVFDQKRQQQQQQQPQAGPKPRKTTQMTIQLGGPEPGGYCGPQGQSGVGHVPEKVFPHPSVPASQQEAEPDPRKYTGGSIPSRSFRMLQAMTGENTGDGGTDF